MRQTILGKYLYWKSDGCSSFADLSENPEYVLYSLNLELVAELYALWAIIVVLTSHRCHAAQSSLI